MLNITDIRNAFPCLEQTIKGHPLAYLDNAATTQKPQCVIDALTHYYQSNNANVHRGVHTLSDRATADYEAARTCVKNYLNANSTQEIIFTRNTTESLNLLAQSFGQAFIQEGDEIILTQMEHHSNIIPWRLLAERTGAKIKFIPMMQSGELALDALAQLITPRTKIMSVSYVSNALGTINPIKKIIEQAHAHNIPVCIDAAQALPHLPIDVQSLECDFLAFSGHKAFGPTGVGVLYAKEKWLEQLPPYQGGGDMILSVSLTETVYSELPYKFEAGTPNIAGVIGLKAALDYLSTLNLDEVQRYEDELLAYTLESLGNIPYLDFVSAPTSRVPIVNFVVKDIHPHDLGTLLDDHGVAIRTGHHCAMPVMQFYHIAGTSRASFAFYNTREEIDQLIEALHTARKVFKL